MAEEGQARTASLLTLTPELLRHVAALVEDTGERARLSAVCRSFRSALAGTQGAGPTSRGGSSNDGAEGSSPGPWRKLCLRGAHVRDPAAYASLVAWLRLRAYEVREAELTVRGGEEGRWETVLAVLGLRLTTLSLRGQKIKDSVLPEDHDPVRQSLVTWTAKLCQQLTSLTILPIQQFVALDHLALLTGLTQLTVDDQGEGGAEFPLELCSLTHLRELDLSSSTVVGLRPEVSSLAQLTQLRLRVAEVQLSDPCWTGLTSLRALYLTLFLTGSENDGPACTALRRRLEVLEIESMDFAGDCLPAALYDLRRLHALRLHCDGGSDQLVVPDQFSRLTKLTSLVLDFCGLNDVPASVLVLPSLRQLSMVGNNLTRLPDGISQLSSLRELRCDHNHGQYWQCNLPASITCLTGLEHLSLQGHRLGDCPALANLADLPSLRVVDLTNCSVLPDGLVYLTQLAVRLHGQGRPHVLRSGNTHPHLPGYYHGQQLH